MTTARNRPSVKLSPRGYDFAGIPTRYFNPGELAALLHLYESIDARVIVEFGVNNGRTPLAAFRNLPNIERYVGVDVTPDYVTNMACQRREIPNVPGELALHDPRFELIVRPRGSFELTTDDLLVCDVAFIDADHSRSGVLNDYALSKELVRPGGLIIFHDDNGLPVVQVTETINDLCASGADIKHVEGTWLAYEVVE